MLDVFKYLSKWNHGGDTLDGILYFPSRWGSILDLPAIE